MPAYTPPLDDMRFLLKDVFAVDEAFDAVGACPRVGRVVARDGWPSTAAGLRELAAVVQALARVRTGELEVAPLQSYFAHSH